MISKPAIYKCPLAEAMSEVRLSVTESSAFVSVSAVDLHFLSQHLAHSIQIPIASTVNEVLVVGHGNGLSAALASSLVLVH